MEPGNQLLLQIQGFASRLKSVLIGGEYNGYLIVTTPKVSGMDTMVLDGLSVTVTFLHDGVVYGFRSHVTHRLVSPARLLFLSYPENIERHELRKHQRVECNIPTGVKIDNGQNSFEGIMADISTGGCRVIFLATSEIIHEQIHPGTTIDLSFELMGIGGVKTLKGTIKSCNAEETKFMLGVSFQQSNNEEALKKVEMYVQSVMKFH